MAKSFFPCNPRTAFDKETLSLLIYTFWLQMYFRALLNMPTPRVIGLVSKFAEMQLLLHTSYMQMIHSFFGSIRKTLSECKTYLGPVLLVVWADG